MHGDTVHSDNFVRYTITMDFRSLDRMGDSDESILDEPYRPFYNIFAAKPVLVKQYNAPLVHARLV